MSLLQPENEGNANAPRWSEWNPYERLPLVQDMLYLPQSVRRVISGRAPMRMGNVPPKPMFTYNV